MSILERITRAFALPAAASDASWQYFGVPHDDYTPEEYGSYLASSNGVYVCSNRRAEYASSVPLKLWNVSSAGRTEVESGNLRLLLNSVNEAWTFHRLMEMTELALCLWGSSFWALNRGASGTRPPTSIWWLRPDRVTVYPGTSQYVDGFGYKTSDGNELLFKPGEIFWLRKPNPMDEFSGLSPLAAARLAADTASAAQLSNRNLFAQGIQLGGFISPKSGQPMLTDEQGKTLQDQFNRKFTGAANAHKWAVMRLDMQFTSMQMTPKDAEYLGALEWSLEEICRAYGIPLDLVGGQRTYANVDASERIVWANTIVPELRMIATELTEQLLPMFPGEADVAEFDVSKVEALQESQNDLHARVREDFRAGLLTLDQAREAIGGEALPNGAGNVVGVPFNILWIDPAKLIDQTAASIYVRPETEIAVEANADPNDPKNVTVPTTDAPPPTPKALPATTEDDTPAEPRATRAIAFGSAEHERMFDAHVRRTEPHERAFATLTANLFRDQQKSILAKLGVRVAEPVDDLAKVPFDLARWIRRFREEARPVLLRIVDESWAVAMADLGVGIDFTLFNPEVRRFIEQRAQRFAVEVNQTTWDTLRAEFVAAQEAGEGIPDIAARVQRVMGDRIRSSATTIARTETIGASNGGTQLAWEASGVVAGKEWLAALDERTRETHVAAHGQRRRLNEDFHVGGGSGPQPGDIGKASEDINCRCTTVAILDVDWVDGEAL